MPASAIKPLTILHTSDWHLGRRLYGRMRYDEFEAFLSWLQDTISEQKVDVLIVAGDIFDTMTPSNRAQALYYEFLGKVSKSCCEHIVIVAGNHDSPTFLDAPSHVLKFLNVYVIGTACEDLKDEVMVLDDVDGTPYCIIAAVPYLRDRDVRNSHAGESADSKDTNVIKGIRAHYDEVASIAKLQQAELIKIHQRHIPVIATGHLFAAGSKTTEDDGVRDLYVGNLGQISAEMFDECFDYVALGHLHVPQRVGGQEHIRYSGSPMPMGFGEARQQKQVLLVQFGAGSNDSILESASELLPKTVVTPIEKVTKTVVKQTTDFIDDLFGFDDVDLSNQKDLTDCVPNGASSNVSVPSNDSSDISSHSNLLYANEANHMQVISLSIPCFQKLAQISGDLTTIGNTIKALDQTESIWLEIIYDGDDIVSELREEVAVMVDGLACEVLKIKNTRTYNRVLNKDQSAETLQDLNEKDVFERCMAINDVPDSQKESLLDAYQQILHNIYHKDSQAE